MPELNAADFDAYFRELWGRPPFAWQQALARRVLEQPDGPWPEVIGLPTGSGKTACIDIAVFTLAARVTWQEGQPATSSLPRRLFFTVDRRLIVDDAYTRASALADKLDAADSGVLKVVADRLRALAGHADAHPLEAHVLRGGMYRNEGWARSPTQPVIICTTVDQLGSRLLFRAYGRSFKAWPIHAGLAGNDSLILLDEAHCAQPLLQTLNAIGQYRSWARQALPNPFFVSVMTATPPAGASDVFRDDSAEPQDPAHPLGRRQLAHKPATLHEPITGSGKTVDAKVADAMAKLAREYGSQSPRAVVVFCNRVATARAIHALLSKGKRNAHKSVLLTGRMRPIDRDDVAGSTLAELATSKAQGRALPESVFVVATQTLEVGADLDFDALITECASLDALRQRFGRLNRMGRDIQAQASIVIRESQTTESSDDPVYGAALANTWQWLAQLADQGNVDFGIAALDAHLPDPAKLATLNVTPPLTPVMLPAHVDTWAQTAPAPEPSADVALFLHGVQRASSDVQVCWRADISLTDEAGIDAAISTLALAPPSTAECLSVPIGVFRRWLAGQDAADTSSDLQGEEDAATGKDDPTATPRVALRWRNRDDAVAIHGSGRLRPGDLFILPADRASTASLGDVPAVQVDARLDIADRASLQTTARARLRLHRTLLATWPQTTSTEALQAWLEPAMDAYEDEPEHTIKELRQQLATIAADLAQADTYHWLEQACAALATDRKLEVQPHPDGGFILRGAQPLQERHQTISFGDEDDATASGTVNMTLSTHLAGVGDFAERFAHSCGLPTALVQALRSAGRLHDLGKADPRFQAMLRNGNRWALGPLLAKSSSLPQSRQHYRAIRLASGYPQGGRHELLSVRLAESAPGLLPSDPILRDLVLHLVASHHGHCRPFAPVIIDPEPQDVKVECDGHPLHASSDTRMERLDSGTSERYWRLTRHFGWWGLAWLEAILRLADHRRSEWEQQQGERKP